MVDGYDKRELQDVIASAKRLNVELDEAEAVAWLDAIRNARDAKDGEKITFDG